MTSGYLTFLKELPKSFSQIGAMLPSSPALGRVMVKPIREAGNRPLRILEVGPGTGPFTRQILELMGSEDHFTICEINPRFLSLLKTNLVKNKYYQRHRERVEFFQGPVQELPQKDCIGKFDIIVSSLPFSNFTPEMVAEILSLFQRLTADEGSVSFYEYVGMRKLSAIFASPSGKVRLSGVENVIRSWTARVTESGEVRTKLSLLNLPPAIAIQFNYQTHAAAPDLAMANSR